MTQLRISSEEFPALLRPDKVNFCVRKPILGGFEENAGNRYIGAESDARENEY
jgi:hypothetical protein